MPFPKDAAKACNIFAFMNDSRGMRNKTCNARFHSVHDTAIFDDVGLPIHPVVATRDIAAGEDILVSYGDSYWDHYKENKTMVKPRAQEGLPSDREHTSMLLWDDMGTDDLRAVNSPWAGTSGHARCECVVGPAVFCLCPYTCRCD